MRGAEGIEKSITFREFWGDVLRAELLHRIQQTFQSLLRTVFSIRPTLYTRFTFTVSRVTSVLDAGSPKVMTTGRTSVQAWFFSSGLSYTLQGAMHQAEMAADTIDMTIQNARMHELDEDVHDAQFFLEFVTCRAYVVKT
jgi:hypothetical protein